MQVVPGRTFAQRKAKRRVPRFMLTQSDGAAREVTGAYDRFVGILADGDRRQQLEALGPDDLESEGFAEPRQISHDFRDGVLSLFFDVNGQLKELTRTYGVF